MFSPYRSDLENFRRLLAPSSKQGIEVKRRCIKTPIFGIMMGVVALLRAGDSPGAAQSCGYARTDSQRSLSGMLFPFMSRSAPRCDDGSQ